MDFDLLDQFKSCLRSQGVGPAIVLAERRLADCEANNFHSLIGRDLLHQTRPLVDFISSFFDRVEKRMQVRAMYGEMNDFTINWESWFVTFFAYDVAGSFDDGEWLADWSGQNSTVDGFELKGFELLQHAYRIYTETDGFRVASVEEASDIAEILIVLRLQELVEHATRLAHAAGLGWAALPIFVTAHDYDDLLYKVRLMN